MTDYLGNFTAVRVGTPLPDFPVRAIQVDHILMFALVLRDSNPIHFDVDAVRSAGLGDQMVNQGGANLAYIVSLLSQWAGSRAAVKRVACRFSANVFAHDDAVAGGVVTGIRDTSQGRLIDCDVWLDLASGSRAISGSASVLLARFES